MMKAVVMSGTGGSWRVRTEDHDVVDVPMRGRLKKSAEDAMKLTVGDEVVRLGSEVLAPELCPQLSDRLLAVVGAGQRVVAAHRPLDRVVDVAHRALGVAAAERRVGVLGGLLVLLRTHSEIPSVVLVVRAGGQGLVINVSLFMKYISSNIVLV